MEVPSYCSGSSGLVPNLSALIGSSASAAIDALPNARISLCDSPLTTKQNDLLARLFTTNPGIGRLEIRSFPNAANAFELWACTVESDKTFSRFREWGNKGSHSSQAIRFRIHNHLDNAGSEESWLCSSTADTSVLSRKFLRCAERNKWNPCKRLAETS